MLGATMMRRMDYLQRKHTRKLIFALLVVYFCAAPTLALDESFTQAKRFDVNWGSLYEKNGHCSFEVDTASGPAVAAIGSFVDGSLTKSNFGQLHITTFPRFADEVQMRAAGFIEGWLTAERIHQHHANVVTAYLNVTSRSPVAKWLEKQERWAWVQAYKYRKESSLWAGVWLLLKQLRGLAEGYRARVTKGGLRIPYLSNTDFLLLSAVGDMYDLKTALSEDRGSAAWDGLTPEELAARIHGSAKCSALVRVTEDLSNLLMSHSTWFTYGAMVRIFKHYSFSLAHSSMKMTSISFSSYPGELSSDDDFYMMDTGLVVMETTNDVLNTKLYDVLTPESLLTWQRSRVASAIATSGAEWADIVTQHNSGTYNNQWMIVDLKRFKPRKSLESGLLWIVELMPGVSVAKDQTEMLEWGYWPSFNVPFYPEIYKAAGYPAFIECQSKRGPEYAAVVAGLKHQLAPRAKIFRRDAHTVESLGTLKRLMRSNNFKKDPFSGGSPWGAICARGDVSPHGAQPYGCTDTKVTDFYMAKELKAEIVNGPTTESFPPFSWSKSRVFSSVQHIGEPDKFDFEFELVRPLRQSTVNGILADGGQGRMERMSVGAS